MIVAWDGLRWLVTDTAWFDLCRGREYAKCYFEMETLGL